MEELVLDLAGNEITIGSKVAYIGKVGYMGNDSKMRIGVVESFRKVETCNGKYMINIKSDKNSVIVRFSNEIVIVK